MATTRKKSTSTKSGNSAAIEEPKSASRQPQKAESGNGAASEAKPAAAKKTSTRSTTGSKTGAKRSTVKKSAAKAPITPEQIALRAHQIWEQNGCPEGQSEAHWFEAERQLQAEQIA